MDKVDKVDKDKIIYPKLSYTIQGCFFELYNTLRYLDLSEEAWEKALVIVLIERGLVVERQVKHQLDYKGQKIGTFYIDIVVNGIILIELKATFGLQP
ncbi:MAG: GxxExxY protein, partial [Ardenticatenaceae bacterium]